MSFLELRYIGKSTLNGSRAPIPSKKFNRLLLFKRVEGENRAIRFRLFCFRFTIQRSLI